MVELGLDPGASQTLQPCPLSELTVFPEQQSPSWTVGLNSFNGLGWATEFGSWDSCDHFSGSLVSLIRLSVKREGTVLLYCHLFNINHLDENATHIPWVRTDTPRPQARLKSSQIFSYPSPLLILHWPHPHLPQPPAAAVHLP